MGFHLVKAIDADARKVFAARDGKNKDVTRYPTYFELARTIPNDELTLQDIYETLHLPYEERIVIIPSVADGRFRRTEILGDEPRNWIQIDIEWLWEETAPLKNPTDTHLSQMIDYSFARLSLPQDIGYVAQRSSSSKIVQDKMFRMRLWIITKQAHTSEEWKEKLSAYEIDHSMFQQSRIHLIYPALAKRGVRTISTIGDDIILKEGAPLDSSMLKKGRRIETRIDRNFGDAQESLGNQFITNRLYAHYENEPEQIPWTRLDKLFKALDEDATENPDAWNKNRNVALGWIVSRCWKKHGDIYNAILLAQKNPAIKGVWTNKDLYAKEESTIRYYRNKWNCGDIRRRFEEEEIKRVTSQDLSTLSDIDLDALAQPNQIVHMQSAVGTGKTKLIKELFSRASPATFLAVSFRIAVLEGYNQQPFNATLYSDVGLGIDGTEKLTVAQRKNIFMPHEPLLSSTVQSLQYIETDKNQIRSFDFMVIDEIEHVLEELHRGSKQTELYDIDKLSKQFKMLVRLAAEAKFVVLADDKASHDLTGWFIELVQRYKEKNKTLLLNDFDWIRDFTFRGYESKETLLLQIARRVRAGQNVYVPVSFADDDDKAKVKLATYLQAIRDLTGLGENEVKGWCAQDFADIDKDEETIRSHPNEVIPMHLANGLRVGVFSYFNNIGWSYEHEGFDATAYICDINFLHAYDHKQTVRRARLVKDVDFYIPPNKNWVAKNDIRKGFEKLFDTTDFVSVADDYDTFQKQSTQCRTYRHEDSQNHFWMHIRDLGADIEWTQEFFDVDEIAHAKNALSHYKKILKDEAQERQKLNLQIERYFGRLRDGMFEPFDSWGEIDPDEETVFLRYATEIDENEMQQIINYWTLGDDDYFKLMGDTKTKFAELHIKLLIEANKVMQPYLKETHSHFLDWVLSDSPQLRFHVTDTPVAQTFVNWTKAQRQEIKTFIEDAASPSALIVGSGNNSPERFVRNLAKHLFLSCSVRKKAAGIVDAYKNLASEYGWKIAKRKAAEVKAELLEVVIDKERRGEELSVAEAEFFHAMGSVCTLSKRSGFSRAVFHALHDYQREGFVREQLPQATPNISNLEIFDKKKFSNSKKLRDNEMSA